MLCRQQNHRSQGWVCVLCLWFSLLDLAMTFSLTPPLSLFSQVLLHKDLPQWAADSWWEGWGGLGGQRKRSFAVSLGNVAKSLVHGALGAPRTCQQHSHARDTSVYTSCLSVCSTCCPRRPSRLCGNQLLTSGCGSPTRWGCHVGWVGTFWEPMGPEEPFETVCRVFPLFCTLLCIFFFFISIPHQKCSVSS